MPWVKNRSPFRRAMTAQVSVGRPINEEARPQAKKPGIQPGPPLGPIVPPTGSGRWGSPVCVPPCKAGSEASPCLGSNEGEGSGAEKFSISSTGSRPLCLSRRTATLCSGSTMGPLRLSQPSRLRLLCLVTPVQWSESPRSCHGRADRDLSLCLLLVDGDRPQPTVARQHANSSRRRTPQVTMLGTPPGFLLVSPGIPAEDRK